MTAVHKDNVTSEHFVVCALYKFVALPDFEAIRQPLLKVMEDNEVRGTLLLAAEGINGTVSAKREGIDNLLAWLDSQPNLDNIVTKESYDDECPFYRTKVKLKKEIVTMGVEGIDPREVVGTYVKPAEWNALKLLNEKGEFISAEAGQELLEIAEKGAYEAANYEGELNQFLTNIYSS